MKYLKRLTKPDRKDRQSEISPAKQTPAGQPQGSRISSFFASAFLSMVLVLILCGVGLYLLQNVRERQEAVARVQIAAEVLARQIQEKLSLYGDLLLLIAKDQDIAKSFLNEDTESLRRMERRLQRQLPGALRIRLLPAEHEDTDSKSKPPLSFASLELLRAAEKSDGVTNFEVHLVGGALQHVAVATKVVYQGQLEPSGVIHVALALDVIQQILQGLDDYRGRFEIQQIVEGGTPIMLAVNNGAGAARGEPDGEIAIGGSIWQVAHWASPQYAMKWFDYVVFTGMPLLVLLLLAVSLFIQTRRLQHALRQDFASIVSVLGEMAKGKTVRSRPARVREAWNTLELVTKAARKFRNQRAKRGKTRLEGAGAADFDDIPDLAPSPEHPSPPSLLPSGIKVDTVTSVEPVAMPEEIFRAYDIRGIVGESLTDEVIYDIGRGIGSEAYDQGQQTVIVGRDGRNSSPRLCDALCRGLQDSGRDVIDLGTVATPVVYFATHYLGSNTGVMVTGSHNPVEYNGLKVVLGGDSLAEGDIQKLRERIESGNLLQGEGTRQEQALIPDYIGRILDDVRLARGMKVVIDCGNGVAATAAPELFQALGCEVIELFCEVDGSFPNHHPDPSVPDNLQPLILEVQAREADIGIAFDGDGDRLGVVDGEGNIIWPDRLLMLLAADVLSRQPGADIIYDVKCSRHLASEILASGGRPLMWKSGHSIMKSKVAETGALLAGDFNGHIIFKERWFGFDDALYAAARLIEAMSLDPRTPAEVFAEQPQSIATPELKVEMQEGEPFAIMKRLTTDAEFPGAKMTTLDGLRAEFEVGWGLVRASNTTPSLVFRFEAENEQGLLEIQNTFRKLLSAAAPDVMLPF